MASPGMPSGPTDFFLPIDLPFEAEFHISGITGLQLLSKYRPFRCLLVRRL